MDFYRFNCLISAMGGLTMRSILGALRIAGGDST